MVGSIGNLPPAGNPPPPSQPQEEPLNTYTTVLLAIEALVQDGDNTDASTSLTALISLLKTQPQTPQVKAAIAALEQAQSDITAGKSSSQIMIDLQNAWTQLEQLS